MKPDLNTQSRQIDCYCNPLNKINNTFIKISLQIHQMPNEWWRLLIGDRSLSCKIILTNLDNEKEKNSKKLINWLE